MLVLDQSNKVITKVENLILSLFKKVNLVTILSPFKFSVQPAAREDGWDTEPFVLTASSDGKKLYGRGATDDKGPVKAHLTSAT